MGDLSSQSNSFYRTSSLGAPLCMSRSAPVVCNNNLGMLLLCCTTIAWIVWPAYLQLVLNSEQLPGHVVELVELLHILSQTQQEF